MFIEELNEELTGRRLAIWLGKNEDGSPINMPIEMVREYRQSWLSKAKGFVKAAGKYALSGFKNVDDVTYKSRLAICNTCPNRETNWTCKLCGCHINMKAKWETETCPEKTEEYPNGRWELIVIKEKQNGCGCTK